MGPPTSTAVAASEATEPAPTPPRGRFRRGPWLAWTALTVVAVIAALALWRAYADPAPYSDANASKVASGVVSKALEKEEAEPTDAARIYRVISPSLVVITTAGEDEQGLGSGVVATDAGQILTAYHVVDGDRPITVTFADGTRSAATITTRQPENDIAVLTPQRLPEVIVPAVLGGGAGVGDDVYALGNPLGLTASLSAGVVSATGRSIKVTDTTTLSELIQFDAAVNPGNSGGPLLNKNGQVVGVVTALANPAKQPFFVGIGFAVPIATAGGAVDAPPQ